MNTSVGGDTRAAKVALRRQLRAARRDRVAVPGDGEAIRDIALAWEVVTGARRIALYASMGTEPDTRPLLAALHDRGIETLLPVVLPDLDLDWALHHPGTLQSVKGLDEPTGVRLGVDAVRTADLVLAPGLAVSTHGSRLGQGGGCYDRALARIGDTPVAVVLHPDEVGVDVPVEAHDRTVDWALTARGLTALA